MMQIVIKKIHIYDGNTPKERCLNLNFDCAILGDFMIPQDFLAPGQDLALGLVEILL